MQARTVLALPLALFFCLACGSEAREREHDAAAQAQPGLGPRATPSEPAAAPEPAPTPAPEVEPEPAPDPELDERKLALANVGRGAFEALEAGDFAALLELTPLHPGPLRDACPALASGNRRELEARFRHCHETIAWDAVAEAQAFAGKPTGAPARGCEDGIEDYGRLQLFLHMQDATIWRVDFFGALGQDGNAVGLNGEVACKQVDEAPPLK